MLRYFDKQRCLLLYQGNVYSMIGLIDDYCLYKCQSPGFIVRRFKKNAASISEGA